MALRYAPRGPRVIRSGASKSHGGLGRSMKRPVHRRSGTCHWRNAAWRARRADVTARRRRRRRWRRRRRGDGAGRSVSPPPTARQRRRQVKRRAGREPPPPPTQTRCRRDASALWEGRARAALRRRHQFAVMDGPRARRTTRGESPEPDPEPVKKKQTKEKPLESPVTVQRKPQPSRSLFCCRRRKPSGRPPWNRLLKKLAKRIIRKCVELWPKRNPLEQNCRNKSHSKEKQRNQVKGRPRETHHTPIRPKRPQTNWKFRLII